MGDHSPLILGLTCTGVCHTAHLCSSHSLCQNSVASLGSSKTYHLTSDLFTLQETVLLYAVCLHLSFLPQKLWAGIQAAVEKGIHTDTSAVSFENENCRSSNCCRLHLLMEVIWMVCQEGNTVLLWDFHSMMTPESISFFCSYATL